MIKKSDLYDLCRSVKIDITDDYRAFEEDEIPGIQLTVACDKDMNEWSYQTGDNSYSGGAYFYPYWAVVGVYRSSNCADLANEIFEELKEMTSY